MAVRKAKGSWWVDFQYYQERLRRRSPLNTKGGAEAFESQLRHLVVQHGSVKSALAMLETKEITKPVTFGEFTERWLRDYVDVNNGVSERYNKRRALRLYLMPAFGSLPLSEVTASKVERFKAFLLKRPLCAKSINNYLIILKKLIACAMEWGLLDAMPRFRLMKTTPPPFRYLDSEQSERLLDAAQTPMLRTMIHTALRTGLRFSELIALRWEDVDLARRQLCVRRAEVLRTVGTTKNGRVRYIPLPSDLIQTLSAVERSSMLVIHHEGRSVRRTTMVDQLARACAVAGVPFVGWHALRHSYASQLVMAGASLAAIRELLGHSTIDMTLRYAHLAPSAMRSTVELLKPISWIEMSARRQPEPDLAAKMIPAPSTKSTFIASTKQKDAIFQ